MNQQVCSNIVDLNKKPEPTPETTALAVTPPTPIEQPKEPEPTQKIEAKVNEIMQSQPELGKPTKVSIVADAYFSVADPILLKNLFEAIHGILDEVTFQFEPERLLIRAMDPSRVCMIDYAIKKEYFEEWRVNKPGYATFNIEEVLKIVFSAIKKDTTVKVTVDPDKDKLIFTLRDSRTRTREFPLLEASIEDIPTPKIQYNALFKVVSKAWQDDLKDIAKSSDHVEIHVAPEGIRVKAQGDLVKAENKYELGSDILLSIEAHEYTHATFSLSYLATGFNFFEPKLCDIVTIEMTTDMPIRATLHTQFGNLYHYLAPRIETD
jgi:proliferating cell nuclear antigen PCNA